MQQPLNSNEIHLWFAFPDEIQDIKLLSVYEKFMNQEERIQHQRFRFNQHRHQYLITRALVRTTLSHYTNIKPQHWYFSKNDYGRPEIIVSEGIPPLRFNLSHTEGLIVCAVVLKQDIGVDVESIERKGSLMEIAKRFFSYQEVQALYALSEEQRQDRFFEYWTLKESYIKARGMGLSLPLKYFSFDIVADQFLQISFEPEWYDDPSQWQFWLLQPTQHHKTSVSVCCEVNQHYQLVMKKVVPLMGEESFFCRVLNQS